MAIDNRTIINDAESVTGWTGDGGPALSSGLTGGNAGLFFEGSDSIYGQHTNSDEETYTTNRTSAPTGTFSLDWSDTTIYLLVKDNLIESQTNGGVKIIIGDGSNRIGYEIGGYDNAGTALSFLFNMYRLDVSNSAAFTSFAFAGNEVSLNKNAITTVGFGSLHLSKAQGNVPNLFIDAIRFIANGSYALTINAGTSGTPITFATVLSEDEDVAGGTPYNGWGMIANPAGSQYILAAPTEWGDTGTGTSYFADSGVQLFLNGTGIGATHFNMRLIGNSTGTNSFSLTDSTVVNLGTRSNWDLSDTNFNLITLDNVTFIDNGTFVFPAQSAGNKVMTGGGFTNCDQVNFDTMDVDNVIFNGTTDANGAMILDTDGNSTNQTDLTFNSDNTGHAVYITATGSYALTNWNFSGYSTANPGTNSTPASGSTDAMIYNNSGGAVTLNITGGIGGNITVRNGASATTTVEATISITFTNIVTGTEVRMYDYTGGVVGNQEFGGNTDSFLESITGTSVTFSGVAQKPYLVKFIKKEYVILRVELDTSSVDITQKITQIFDRNYSNP